MKKIVILLVIALLMVQCKNFFSNKNDAVPVNLHEVIAKEVINTSAYTYVKVTENNAEQWLAIPISNIKIGNKYYYKDGMLMEKFESRELKRTFDSVIFLEVLSENMDDLSVKKENKGMGETQEHTNVNTSNIRKLEIKILAAKDGISIAELYSKKDQYSGKKVRISGQVTKFNAEIMKKNWVHIQDGSESNGKFDLTITTSDKAQVGDTLTFEGEIELDKDFGYGYFYDLIMVDAKIAK